jgi:hypothetical protein
MTIGDEVKQMFAVLGASGKYPHAIRTWVNMEQKQAGSGEELGPAATASPSAVKQAAGKGKKVKS